MLFVPLLLSLHLLSKLTFFFVSKTAETLSLLLPRLLVLPPVEETLLRPAGEREFSTSITFLSFRLFR